MDGIYEDIVRVYFRQSGRITEKQKDKLNARKDIRGGSRNLISISYTSPLSRTSNDDSSGLIGNIVASSSLDLFDEAFGTVTCSS